MFDQFEASVNPLMQLQGYELELHDFIESSNFDQFVDLIRGENENPVLNFDRDFITNGCFVNDQFGSSNAGDILDFNGVAGPDSPDFMMFNRLEKFDDGVEGINGGEEDDENDGEDSSATTTTATNETTTKRANVDRSRTLISERSRRGRMKEKLYALRSLVPNITKMDKASIVGDAVLYVQDLQMQAKKLKAEIKGLEASIERCAQNPTKVNQIPHSTSLVSKKIVQMDIFQVEERGFYLRIVCDKGNGVAMCLYKVLESLVGFNVQSSNLVTDIQTFVLTATLNVMKDWEQEMNLPNLKLWLTGALLNQGFEFKSQFPAN